MSAIDYDHLLHLYGEMFRIRRVEEESARAYAQGKIGGFLHLYIGQEACAVGMCAPLTEEDYVITTYRDHGLALTRGMSAAAVMAELFGKDGGCSRGLGGSMHFFDAKNKMMGGHGIVGSHVPLGAGFAFACKYRKTGGISVCFLGDGAVPQGDFHEALSLAALWKLPAIFVVENNDYAMGTPMERTMSVDDITTKAAGYGMASDRFDVEDVLEVEKRMKIAIDRARNESLPTLIEAKTYRFRGHSMSDPGKYRTKEEVEEEKRKDPLRRARTQLVDGGREKDVEALEQRLEAEVQAAIEYADNSPEPDASLLEETTYLGPFAR